MSGLMTHKQFSEWAKQFAKEYRQYSDIIYSAHELLEALETLERLAGLPLMQDDPARVKARAAIAKARGQE